MRNRRPSNYYFIKRFQSNSNLKNVNKNNTFQFNLDYVLKIS